MARKGKHLPSSLVPQFNPAWLSVEGEKQLAKTVLWPFHESLVCVCACALVHTHTHLLLWETVWHLFLKYW